MGTSEKQKSYLAEYAVALGYIIFFCAILTLFFSFLIFNTIKSETIPTPVNVFATKLPPIIPTPHMNPAQSLDSSILFADNFNNDKNKWGFDDAEGKAIIDAGQLILKSKKTDYYQFTQCEKCPYLNKPYYLKADLSTKTPTSLNYGIVFSVGYDNNNFYAFLINPESRKYIFYRHTYDNWSEWTAGESQQIQGFPAVNTVGIYANGDTVEFFINGKIVDAYQQADLIFQKGFFGFYVDDSGFELVIDQLTVSKVEE